MTLRPKDRLGSYEIMDAIGAGGMGEVYRARDLKLDRHVAIKVLPEGLSQDRDRLARFEREAKLLAALNHEGIATLYGLEYADGRPFLVMELVPGETLAERIARGSLSLEAALRIFRRIAEALEAAHEKGIIHRDLKPANIKVIDEDHVKLLDFGLAKAYEGPVPNADMKSSQSPTLTKNTALGTILGTASYMSPEQARGKTVDPRTDVWAFGCCLYEALTGRKAFDGETIADVLSKVLQTEPDWSSVPPGIEGVLRRALEKDPQKRIHAIADVRLLLEEKPGDVPRPTPRRMVLPIALTAVLAAAAGALSVWLATRGALSDELVRRFSINLPEGDDFISGGIEGPLVTISPDGSHIVYPGIRDGVEQLFLRPVEATEAVPISGTERGRMPFFSPDGRSIGFAADGVWKQTSIDGGPPTTIAPQVGFGAVWLEDDSIVFGDGRQLSRVTRERGAPQQLTELDEPGGTVWWPNALPGGRAVLYGIGRDIVVRVLETGEHHVLIENAMYPRYVASGHIAFHREGVLFGIPFDLDRLETMGSAVPILENVGWGGAREGYFDVSQEGTLVYVAGQTKPEIRFVLVDREGKTKTLGPTQRASWRRPRFSPDGRRIVVMIEPQNAPPHLWTLDVEREQFVRITARTGAMSPHWSSDGSGVFFQSAGLSFQPITGEGAEEIASFGSATARLSSGDGGNIVFFIQRSDRGDMDIVMLRIDDPDATQTILDSGFDEHSPELSPDGRWLAFVANDSGQNEVYVQAFPGPGLKVKISRDGGTEPAWSRDGREIFYRNGSKMMAASVSGGEQFQTKEPTLIFDHPFFAQPLRDFREYDVAPDGSHFLMIQSEEPDTRPEIHVVLNWFDELERLVPHDR